jgi:hypothetical protein
VSEVKAHFEIAPDKEHLLLTCLNLIVAEREKESERKKEKEREREKEKERERSVSFIAANMIEEEKDPFHCVLTRRISHRHKKVFFLLLLPIEIFEP